MAVVSRVRAVVVRLEAAVGMAVVMATDSLDASSLKSSEELVSSNMKGKLDSIRNLLQK